MYRSMSKSQLPTSNAQMPRVLGHWELGVVGCLLVVDDLCVDHFAAAVPGTGGTLSPRRPGTLSPGGTRGTLGTTSITPGCRAGLLIERLRGLVLRLRQLLHALVHRRDVVAVDGVLQRFDRTLDRG